MRHRNHPHPQHPTKPHKALAALLTTVAGLVGVTLTDGTAQLVAALLLALVNAFAVWRTPNPPLPVPGMPGEFLAEP